MAEAVLNGLSLTSGEIAGPSAFYDQSSLYASRIFTPAYSDAQLGQKFHFIASYGKGPYGFVHFKDKFNGQSGYLVVFLMKGDYDPKAHKLFHRLEEAFENGGESNSANPGGRKRYDDLLKEETQPIEFNPCPADIK